MPRKRLNDDLVLLRYDGNWSDEFDVNGLLIVEKTWWTAYQKDVREKFGKQEREVGFGTNEALTFCDADDYLFDITEVSATQDEILTMKKLLGGTEFGIFPLIEFDDD